MPLTAEQKQAAKDALRVELSKLHGDTLSYWIQLIESGEELRKASGYSQGIEDMMQKLVKAYRKKHNTLMKPFDRGDFD